MVFSAPAGAAGPPAASEVPAKPHFIEQIIPFVFIFLLFYFLLIRPAQKRQKRHQELIDRLKKGDQVLELQWHYGNHLWTDR